MKTMRGQVRRGGKGRAREIRTNFLKSFMQSITDPLELANWLGCGLVVFHKKGHKNRDRSMSKIYHDSYKNKITQRRKGAKIASGTFWLVIFFTIFIMMQRNQEGLEAIDHPSNTIFNILLPKI